LARSLCSGLTFGRLVLAGRVSLGKLTVSAIATVEIELSPSVSISVIAEENDHAGMTVESGFVMSL
jgi:hypothetical protein